MNHYYGDIVRKLFIGGGILMIVLLPFFYDLIPYATIVSVIAILVIGFFAGAVAPMQKWSIITNMAVSAIAFLIFEYQAVNAYVGQHIAFSLANQVLAATFFAAFYYGVKSTRGSFVKDKRAGSEDFALEMLKSRYAKGEITTKEYEEKKRELEK